MMSFVFSVVMPLYNVEEYFDEAIESVIGQTLGMERIQIILVNDGSTDSTKDKCEYYAAKYPESVSVINKDNGGVSSARNAGIEMIEGKYTVFFDGDDVWDHKAFELISRFFDSHYDEIDVCSCRMKYFGDFVKQHPLDFKFKNGSRVIDLRDQPNYVQATIGNVVFKTSAIKEREFKTSMKYCEDSLFENTVILDRLKIGIVSDAVFYYRRTSGSATKSISQTPYWYLNVFTEYYDALIDLSREIYGRTIPYIQAVLIYDIQWRGYSPDTEIMLSSDELNDYQMHLIKVLQQIDDQVLISYASVNQYKKLALLNIKHGRNILKEAKLDTYKYMFEEKQILSLRTFSVLQIQVLGIDNNTLHIEGIIMNHECSDEVPIYIVNESNEKYSLETEPHSQRDVYSLFGECVAKGIRFQVELPALAGEKYRFVYIKDDNSVVMNPDFSNEICLSRRVNNSFTILSDFIVKYSNNKLCIYADSMFTRAKFSYKLKRELLNKQDDDKINEYKNRFYLSYKLKRLHLKSQAAFISNRANDAFLPNIKAVYEAYSSRKIGIAKKSPYTIEDIKRIAKIIYQSRVVVTDDYCYFFRIFGKKRGQHFIQIWHAAGAFKRFGMDGTPFIPSIERKYHCEYDLVCVSSDYVRDIYAQAFGIPADRVRAIGVPRTDMFFDKAYLDLIRDKIYDAYSRILHKKVILYAPTFRDIPGKTRAYFAPELDFQALSDVLPDDTVFVICPHPVMKETILDNEYHNILEIRDISTNEMMLVSDLLITDYSSVIFEYSLLNKPIIFYCYDYDDYDRDFYLDYENELPGAVFKSQNELFDYISKGIYIPSDKIHSFRERYMSACDGHSTERVVEYIKRMNRCK